MTKEEYDKIVEPVAPFKEIEKKQPMSIVEFVEEVSGRELNEWQKEYITATYMYYKNNSNGMIMYAVRGSGTTNILPFLAIVFAAYEGKEIKPCTFITKEE